MKCLTPDSHFKQKVKEVKVQLTQEVYNELCVKAKDVAMAEVKKQLTDVAHREHNKVYIAMSEAGLSAKTIARVQAIMNNNVEPWYADWAEEGLADTATRSLLRRRGIPAESIEVQT